MATDPTGTGAITSGDPASNTEIELRNENSRLDQENRDLRARLGAAGVTLPEPRERRFELSEGVRQDLILLRHRVDAGELKAEDATVADPATGRVFTLDDLPSDSPAIPGVGAPESKPASGRRSSSSSKSSG
jgi:hypothetical protein